MTNVSLNNQGLNGQNSAAFDQTSLGGQQTLTGLDALRAQPTFTFEGANQRGLANSPGLDDDAPPITVVGRPQRETLGEAAPPWLRVSGGQLLETPLDKLLSTDYQENYQNQCETDKQVDSLAQQISNLIKSQPDWNEREYGAVIYRDANGNLKIGPLTKGQTMAEAIRAGLGAPETRLSVPADLGAGQIIAVVHNHPDIGYNNAEDIINRYPSNNPGYDGDYQTFNALVGSDKRFSNSAEFSLYILGPDGKLREFNASEGVVDSSNDTKPNERDKLNSDRPCSNG